MPMSYKWESKPVIKLVLIHHYLNKKMPAPAHAFDSCYLFVLNLLFACAIFVIYYSLENQFHISIKKQFKLNFIFQILFSFGYYWHAKVGIGYAHLSLLAEFSSFLLHARKLMRIIGYSSDSLQYHIFSIVNLVSFFILRLIPLSIVVSNIYPEYFLMRVHLFYFTTLSISAIIIWIINIGFFLKLIRTDFIRLKQKRK